MRVSAPARQEFKVGTLFNDPAAVDDHNTVGEARGRQAMSNDQGCTSCGGPLQRFNNGLFRSGIQAARRLIKNQNGRVAQNRARDGDPLFLSPGEAATSLRHESLVAFRESRNKLVGIGRYRGGNDRLVAGIGTAKSNVFADGAAEQQRVL